MKKPVCQEFPFYVINLEAARREDYLVNHYLQDATSQESNGIFPNAIKLLYLKKIGAYGKGRSGAAARDFASRMKSRAKYTGREFNSEVRPMCYFLDDLSATFFPPVLSTILLISGTGSKESVVQKSLGCLAHKIKTIAFSYEPMSAVARCADVYHHIPKKIDSNADRRSTIDVLGNSFETAANISGGGLVEGLIEYHRSKDLKKASEICLKYINNSVKYVKHLGEKLENLKQELIALGCGLSAARDVRLAASGDNAASLQMAMNRLAHTGRTGFDSSIDFISSDNFGPPGYADIGKNDLVIISSSELGSSHTIAIGREATRVNARLCLIASDRLMDEPLQSKLSKYEIKQPDILLRLPFSLPNSDERFFDLGVRHVLEYEAAAVFENLGLTEQEVESMHLQKELE